MEVECSSCNETINNIDFFECDGCTKKYHLRCDGIKKKELLARKESTRLRLFCNECLKATDEIQSENIKTVLSFVHKIDYYSQVQEKQHSQIAYDVERIKDALQMVTKNLAEIKSNEMKSTEGLSYADMVKKSKNLPVIIKPKETKQTSSATIEEVKNKVSYKEVKANGIRKMRDGSIAINCNSQAESIKIKEIVQNKIGDKYVVEIPAPIKPRLKILSIDQEMSHEEMIEDLKFKNYALSEAEIVVKTTIKRNNKNKNKVCYDAIIEVEEDIYNVLLMMKVVVLGWHRYRVVENISMTRCYKCCGFGHMAKDCKNKQACSKCGEDHKHSECKSSELKCINCCVLKEKLKIDLDVKHSAYDKNCQIFKKRYSQLKEKFSVRFQNK